MKARRQVRRQRGTRSPAHSGEKGQTLLPDTNGSHTNGSNNDVNQPVAPTTSEASTSDASISQASTATASTLEASTSDASTAHPSRRSFLKGLSSLGAGLAVSALLAGEQTPAFAGGGSGIAGSPKPWHAAV